MTIGRARPPHRDAQLAQQLQTLLGKAAPAALAFCSSICSGSNSPAALAARQNRRQR